MNEKSNYDIEDQPLTEPDKSHIIESSNISEKIGENITPPDNNNYKLPPKQHIEFNLQTKDKKIKLTEKDNEILKLNKEYMESKLWYWKLDDFFKFDLPPTIFTEKKIIDSGKSYQYANRGATYENPSIIGKRFSSKILKEIWYKGEFNIQSNIPDFPYTWHIVECMIKGYDKVKESFFSILSFAFMFIYTLKYRFYTDKYDEYCSFSIKSSFYHLYKSMIRFVDLFFGIPLYSFDKNTTKKQIMFQKFKNFNNKNPDFDFDFFNEQTKIEFKKLDEKFELKWVKEINPSILLQWTNISAQEMANYLKNKRLDEFIKFLTSDEQFKHLEKFHPSAKDYLLSQQIINDKSFYNKLEKNMKLEKYEEQLKNNYIRYLCEFWRDDNMDSFKIKLEKETKEKIENEIKKGIRDKKDPIAVYTFNTSKEDEIQELTEKYSKKNKKPKVTHTFLRNLCCYNILESLDPKGNIIYTLQKETDFEIKSSFFFWRTILFILKFFFDFWNFNLFFFRLMINSMFGIKALIFCELYRDYDINPKTGEKILIEETTTFPGSLRNLWITVQESRTKFENAPDTGILGKGCMRIFHLFYNYIICLFFLGMLLIVFYPLMIFLTISISLLLIIFSPILIMLWTIFDYLFTLFIYNRFDEELNITPILFVIVIELVFGFFLQLLLVLILLIGQPTLSLIIFIFAQIYFIVRVFLNCFFISIIACFGRVPQSDSCVAWQVSGPGIFVERYYDLANKDIIYLVVGYLENITMENFRKKMEKMLESPNEQIREIKHIFRLLGLDFVLTEDFEDSIEFYKDKLDSQINKRNFYPVCKVKVKFTEERLQEVKYMITLYVSEYSKVYDISNELNKYKKMDYFVEDILKSIFDSNILVPLEKSEKYTHLKSVFNNEIDVIAKKIFENPYFQDKIIVEENIEDKNKVKGESKGPLPATFEQIFKGDLNLNFYPLSEREREEIISKCESIVKFKY